MSNEMVPDVEPFGALVLIEVEREAKVGAIHVPDAAQGVARAKVVRVGPEVKWAKVGDHVLPHPSCSLFHVPGAEGYVLAEEAFLLGRDNRTTIESARVIAEPAMPRPKRRVRGEWQ